MYRVDEAVCTGCGDCIDACPAGAIALVGGRARIDEYICSDCGSCADACPQGAIVMAAVPAYVTRSPATGLAVVSPPAAAVEPASLTRWPQADVLPAVRRRSPIWPMVGGALVWAARELLPEVLAAWRASGAGVRQAISYKPDAFNQLSSMSMNRRKGHRHRWGRA